MMLLPKTVGPFTLIRKLGTGGVAESYHGILDEQGSQKVVVRRILPYVLQDPIRMASTEARVRDLLGVRHPFLVRVLDWVADGSDRFIVEDWVEGVSLERVLRWCRENETAIPHNVYLNLATQICNGLEALHGRPGKGTGSQSVLHLALKPSAVQVTREGKVVLGSYGLTRSPTVLSHGGMQNPVPVRVEYLSPEQTHPDQKLTPASDIFSLGSFLYELLTLDPLFRSESNLQTINRIRRVEITTQLLKAREAMPGLDKVLYRALSLNPRHRYQRAFVLREDLRGLMAGYSFSTIVDDTRHFIGQIIDSQFEGGQYDSGIHHSPVQTGDTDRRAAEALADSAALRDGLKVAASNPDEEHTEPPHPVEDLLLDVSIHDQPTESASEAILSALRAEVFTEDPPSTVEYSPLSERVTEDLPDGDLPDGDLDLDEEQDPDSEQEPGAAAVMVMPSRPSEVAPDPRDEPELDEAEDSLFEPSSEQATEQAAEQATGLQPSQDESEVTDILPGMLFDPSTADDEPPLPRPLLAEDEVFDPNSTAGFLRGHQPASPRPPSVEPSPRIAAAPPPVSIAERAPPPVSITERAPPPVRPRRVEPAPQPEADLDEPTPRSRVPMMALVAAAALVVVCGGGSALVWGAYSALRGGEELAAVTPAQKPPVTAPAREPAEEPITAEETAEDALAAAQPVEEPVRPEPTRTEPVRPEPVRPASSSSASSSSAASSSAASSSAASSRTEPTSRPTSAPASSARTVAEDDSLAFLDDDDGRSMEPIEAEPVELDRYTQAAARGSLNRSDILALETVDFSDDDFTRSRALLLMNAQRSNDERATRQYLEELMRKPENQYNPVFLTDYARYYANRGSFSRALEQANLAERHWQRLPSELIFVKKAEIYEIQAASYQGLFYDSDSDTDLLLRSIRHWEKLKEHVQGRDSARTAQADAELAKLRDIQRRLEN